jgi:hypothetical protein
MFATLLGGLPMPDLEPGQVGDTIAAIAAAVRAQEAAGLEPVTDGRLRDPAFDQLTRLLVGGAATQAAELVVEGWRATASLTVRAVKQTLPGPYSIVPASGRAAAAATGRGGAGDRTMAAADGLRTIVQALTSAGCPMVEIEETDADRIGDDEAERRRFRDAHRLLAQGVEGTHLSLSIVGGSAAGAGIETILDAPYASLAVDLIAGPDNWKLVTALPGDRGVVAGVQGGREDGDEAKEIMLWAAHYAASTGGRGIARVGLGSAGSWANLTWGAAVRKMELLATAATLAGMAPGEALVESVDPQAVSARRAALGRNAPPAPRRKPQR